MECENSFLKNGWRFLFGLETMVNKLKQHSSRLKSMVEAIVYSCIEVRQFGSNHSAFEAVGGPNPADDYICRPCLEAMFPSEALHGRSTPLQVNMEPQILPCL